MYQETIDQFADSAAKKVRAIGDNPLGFFIASCLTGVYVGLGVIAIFSIGQVIDPGVPPLAIGLTFAIALTLVVFAGAELFARRTMMMTLGALRGKVGMSGLASSWVMTWLGNLAGSVALGGVFYLGGGGQILKSGADLIFNVAAATIFWCLFAFSASGFEHSVANMTLFVIALFAQHRDTVSTGGMFYNLLWVTLGNLIAGVVFVPGAYWQANGRSAVSTSIAAPAAVPAE